ncbi:MAG: hypothetical protein ACRD6U_04745 [Nitrososphaeraceae archaeon]
MSEPNSISDTNIKFIVPIKLSDKSMRLSDEVKNELKSIGMMDEKGKLKLKGVSPNMLNRMKMVSVDCPVLQREISFIPCYVCKNFHSRITGQVYCRGEPL